jgi:hypothetical protein
MAQPAASGPRSLQAADQRDGGVMPIAVDARPEPAPLPPNVLLTDEPTTFDPGDVNLRKNLPRDTALLCVTPDWATGTSLFRLHIYVNGERGESGAGDVLLQSRPPLTLADVVRRGKWRKDFHTMMDWWGDKGQLAAWMQALISRVRAGAPLRLIVWDQTDYQIPWELYYSDPDGAPPAWLGATLEVSRWTSINVPGRIARYTARVETCRGPVLALETTDLSHYGQVLGPALAPFGVAPLTSMPDLLAKLADTSQRFALLLIRCHGKYAASIGEQELGGVTMAEFREHRMEALRETKAVVLLNACDTASLTSSAAHAYAATRTFAEVFLRRGANSVIATVGLIDQDHSHSFAVRLLQNDGSTVRLGELLLRHRQDGVEHVKDRVHPDTREAADFEAFFYSFMYIYFGHPDSSLELVRVNGADHG